MVIIILQSETGSALVFLSLLLCSIGRATGAVPAFGIFLALLFVLVLRFSSVTWGITQHHPYFLVVYLFLAFCQLAQPQRPTHQPSLLTIAPVLFAIYGILSLFREVDFSQPALISLLLLIIACMVVGIWRQKRISVYCHRGLHDGLSLWG